MTRATIDSVAPFFIARDVERSLEFYRDKLGFTVVFQEVEPPQRLPFFAIVSRDSAMLFLKGSGEAVPNAKRYAWARFDAYFLVPDRMRWRPSSRVEKVSASAKHSRTRTTDCAASS